MTFLVWYIAWNFSSDMINGSGLFWGVGVMRYYFGQFLSSVIYCLGQFLSGVVFGTSFSGMIYCLGHFCLHFCLHFCIYHLCLGNFCIRTLALMYVALVAVHPTYNLVVPNNKKDLSSAALCTDLQGDFACNKQMSEWERLNLMMSRKASSLTLSYAWNLLCKI